MGRGEPFDVGILQPEADYAVAEIAIRPASRVPFLLAVSAILIIIAAVSIGVVDAGDMVISFPLNETSGTTATDDTAYGNDGTVSDPVWEHGYTDNALRLDGNDTFITVPDAASLDLTQTVVLSAYVNMSETNRTQGIISKGSYVVGVGSDNRPYFEIISNATGTTWMNVGDPGSDTRMLCFAVWRGSLFVGTYNNGGIYRYDGGDTWTSIGTVGLGQTYIKDLAVYGDTLYAATGALNASVFRYDGGVTWTRVGVDLCGASGDYVIKLAVSNDKLYAGTIGDSKVYEYQNDGSTWTDVGTLGAGGYNVEALAPYNNTLYGGLSGTGHVYRWTPGTTTWTDLGQIGSETFVYTLAEWQGRLYAGGRGAGTVYRYDGGTTWTSIGDPDGGTDLVTYTYELIAHNNDLYAATGRNSTLFRYSGSGTVWSTCGNVSALSDIYGYALASYNGSIWMGTGDTSGVVLRYGNGANGIGVNATMPLANNTWYKLTASYNGSVAAIYVNDVLNGSKTIAGLAAGTNTQALTVGKLAGTPIPGEGETYFKGLIDAVKLFSGTNASFTADTGGGDAPLLVSFTDQSVGYMVGSWNWSFGDGNVSALENPTFTFNIPGVYTVQLIATDSLTTQSDTETRIGYINVTAPAGGAPVPPTCDFTADDAAGDSPHAVQFTDTSTADGASAWYWIFGDGNTSVQEDPLFTYRPAGLYTVNHSVTNASGTAWKNVSSMINVSWSSAAPVPPTAAFSATPTDGTDPLSVQFTDTSIVTDPTGWIWYFGDGNASGSQNPLFVYNIPGIYTVNHRVQNASGNDWENKTAYINVRNTPPVSGFTGSNLSGDAPLVVKFTDSTIGLNVSSWYWTFGDGNTSVLEDPLFTYTINGTYTVSHRATNDGGSDWENKTAYITVGGTVPPTPTPTTTISHKYARAKAAPGTAVATIDPVYFAAIESAFGANDTTVNVTNATDILPDVLGIGQIVYEVYDDALGPVAIVVIFGMAFIMGSIMTGSTALPSVGGILVSCFILYRLPEGYHAAAIACLVVAVGGMIYWLLKRRE